ncbi:DUF2690 domain-containing protein [Actinoplanes subglobosus]|uniref:DUF2690 domain-containing protein n=1 Tax=Actinoplanes subglobosus TaxID=1547892 RepID=A0ABV8IQ88_9ACTN
MIRNAVRAGIAAIAATGAVLALSATPAFAACGNKCDGENPFSYTYLEGGGVGAPVNCKNSAVTPENTDTKTYLKYANRSIYIELRYSTVCRTAWARTNAVGWTINTYSYKADGSFRTSTEQHTNSTVKYSAMVNDAGLTAKACIWVPVSDTQVCTSKY